MTSRVPSNASEAPRPLVATMTAATVVRAAVVVARITIGKGNDRVRKRHVHGVGSWRRGLRTANDGLRVGITTEASVRYSWHCSMGMHLVAR